MKIFKDIDDFAKYMEVKCILSDKNDMRCEFIVNGIERTIDKCWGRYFTMNLGCGSFQKLDELLIFLKAEYPSIFRKMKIEKLLNI